MALQDPYPADSGDSGPTIIKAKQGRSYGAVIARNQLNRIVTPFDEPKALTVSGMETKVDGNSVYVATDSFDPASLYITNTEGSEAISLELTPVEKTRPSEIRIELDRGFPIKTSSLQNDSADGKADHPYVDDIKAMFRALALGNVPQGYSLEDSGSQPFLPPTCAMPGVGFRAGQYITGSRANIAVLVATNNGGTAVIMDETVCTAPQVMAVSIWPRFRLLPGESTEVYVAVKVDQEPAEQARPSLLPVR
jgi:conjugal transfer pilus assembly protein TraK